MPVLLGVIADDLTGATDLCSMLVRQGVRTVQLIGAPEADVPVPDAEAITVALKSRTIPADQAIAMSLQALAWLKAAGARRFLFKYCSTFDSTDAGNIGPVADALLDALGAEMTIACPAFPENGRAIFKGHLFVGDVLLSDSAMRHHPLTPMTDGNLVRVLARQTPHGVGLLPWEAVQRGEDAIRHHFAELRGQGIRHVVADAISDADLVTLGAAFADLPLITGGSGIALGLPDALRRRGLLEGRSDAAIALPAIDGAEAVLAGSCSAATLAQVEHFAARHPAFKLDPLRLSGEPGLVDEVVAWALPHLGREPILVHASAPPEEVASAQARLGREQAGTLIETAMAAIASGLVAAGVRRLVVAGGETSGAVVQALKARALTIGPPIDPGVPACVAMQNDPPLALALKSGNFGAVDFFEKALRSMPGRSISPAAATVAVPGAVQ